MRRILFELHELLLVLVSRSRDQPECEHEVTACKKTAPGIKPQRGFSLFQLLRGRAELDSTTLGIFRWLKVTDFYFFFLTSFLFLSLALHGTPQLFVVGFVVSVAPNSN